MSQVYDVLDAYERARDLMLDSMSLVLGRRASDAHPLDFMEDMYQLNGRLLLLDQAHTAIQEQMEELLAHEETASAPE